MAKRLTNTNKYKSPFFRSLQGAYKLLWDFLYHDCDHAGIWIVDFEIAQTYIGRDMPIDKQEALKYFNTGKVRIIEIDGGKRWFSPGFIEEQYNGKLNPENRTHASVIKELDAHDLLNHDFSIKLLSPSGSPLQGAKDKDKDKDKEQDKDKDKDNGRISIEQAEVEREKFLSREAEKEQILKNADAFIAPSLLTIYKTHKPKYIIRIDQDMEACRKIGEIIAEQEKVDVYTDAGREQVKTTWEAIVAFILADKFYKDHSLMQVERYIVPILNKMQGMNETPVPDKNAKKSLIQKNAETAAQTREILKNLNKAS